MKFLFSQKAKEQVGNSPQSERNKVERKLRMLEDGIVAGKKLKGDLGQFCSLKAWPYRILYKKTDDGIFVEVIEHRQGVYK